jgi:hypothetical protein
MPKATNRSKRPARLKHPAEDTKRAEIAALKRVSRLTTQITRLQRALDAAIARASREQLEYAIALLDRQGYTVVPMQTNIHERREPVNA